MKTISKTISSTQPPALAYALIAAFSLFVCGDTAAATAEYWDTSTTTGLQGGTGTWDTGTTTLWSTVSTGSNPLVAWTGGSDANFNAGTNTVTISGTVTANQIVQGISTTSTTISGGAITLSNNPAISVNGGSMTIANTTAVTLTQDALKRSALTTSGAGLLTINGNIAETLLVNPTTLRISGTGVTLGGNNTFGGGVQINNTAALNVTNINAFGSGNILFGQSGTNGATGKLNFNLATDATLTKTIIYNGDNTGTTSNSAVINSNGAGALIFNSGTMNTGNVALGSSSLVGGVGALDLKLGGTSTAANTFSGVIKDMGTGTSITSFTKQDAGTWILTGANTYSGTTTVNGGILSLGVTNEIKNSATNAITLGGGTLKSAFSQKLDLATLSLTAGTANVLDLASGGTFSFANSSAATWGTGSTLSIVGTFTDGVSVRFGSDGSGLSGTQIGQISINGLAASINVNGFLQTSSIPEPSTYAVIIGGGCLACAAFYRRRRQ